jgi:hypothetical protein
MPIGASRIVSLALAAGLAVGALAVNRPVYASQQAPLAQMSGARQIVTPTSETPTDTAIPPQATLTPGSPPSGMPVSTPGARQTSTAVPADERDEPDEPNEAPPSAPGQPAEVMPTVVPSPAAAPAGTAPSGAASDGAAGEVTAIGLFPDLGIASVLNGVLPGTVRDDHQILLGGVGSDIWHGPDDAPDELWMVTDRGPRGADDNGKNREAFAIPEYTPMILHVRINTTGGVYSVELLDTIPVVGQSGQPVTGLPNLDGRDDRPVDYRAKQKLNYNPSGIDPEGLVRAPNGDFWLAEEYGPSLLHLDARGHVLTRFVPEGIVLDGADYPVSATLPGLFAKRSDSQGFEGLTLSPDGGTLYLAMQGPLSNPNNTTGDHSRQIRILAFDVASEQVVAEYVYRFELIRSFDPSKKADPENLKLSALAMAPDGQLLMLERSPNAARLYLADLQHATNILGSRWDDPATKPSLEAAESLAVLNVLTLTKTLALDLTQLPGVPDKLEGIAIVDPSTIVVANDNDFDVNKFDSTGANQGKNEKSQVVAITLAKPLP